MKKKNRQSNHIQLHLSASQCFCPEFKGHWFEHSSSYRPEQETQEIPNRFFSMTDNPCPDLMHGMQYFPKGSFCSLLLKPNQQYHIQNVHFCKKFYLLPVNTWFVGGKYIKIVKMIIIVIIIIRHFSIHFTFNFNLHLFKTNYWAK